MPDWLVEHGIGETRAALVQDGEILEARVTLEGVAPAGTTLAARLADVGTNRRNAVAVARDGTEYLLPRGAPEITQGATLMIEVTREPIPGPEIWKLPLARIRVDEPTENRRVEFARSREIGLPAPSDALAAVGWNDLVEQARTGLVAFPGGELRLAVTSGMTIIDVDGYLQTDELAVVGAEAAARAIRRLGIGGSIGIDLPTVSNKARRQAAAEKIDLVLPRPFERTAVNGFGFVQIVRPRPRPSLLEIASDRAMFEARALLRRIAFEAPGSKTLVANPEVMLALERNPAWIESLSRQVGGSIRLRADPVLPMSGGYAEAA